MILSCSTWLDDTYLVSCGVSFSLVRSFFKVPPHNKWNKAEVMSCYRPPSSWPGGLVMERLPWEKGAQKIGWDYFLEANIIILVIEVLCSVSWDECRQRNLIKKKQTCVSLHPRSFSLSFRGVFEIYFRGIQRCRLEYTLGLHWCKRFTVGVGSWCYLQAPSLELSNFLVLDSLDFGFLIFRDPAILPVRKTSLLICLWFFFLSTNVYRSCIYIHI